MLEQVPDPLFWSLVAIQLIGLTSAFLARLGQGSDSEGTCQFFFLACLAVISLVTMGALVIGHSTCLTCGTTLSVMVLGATVDFGSRGRRAET